MWLSRGELLFLAHWVLGGDGFTETGTEHLGCLCYSLSCTTLYPVTVEE